MIAMERKALRPKLPYSAGEGKRRTAIGCQIKSGLRRFSLTLNLQARCLDTAQSAILVAIRRVTADAN